jgi:hypothetical protein
MIYIHTSITLHYITFAFAFAFTFTFTFTLHYITYIHTCLLHCIAFHSIPFHHSIHAYPQKDAQQLESWEVTLLQTIPSRPILME